jgi:hypothetical protein
MHREDRVEEKFLLSPAPPVERFLESVVSAKDEVSFYFLETLKEDNFGVSTKYWLLLDVNRH